MINENIALVLVVFWWGAIVFLTAAYESRGFSSGYMIVPVILIFAAGLFVPFLLVWLMRHFIIGFYVLGGVILGLCIGIPKRSR